MNIPATALEAGARALARYNCEQWDNDPDRWRAYFTDEARAAFLAMLEAWDGAHGANQIDGITTPLILPMTEKPDDKA